jgi:hypothetical protein
LIVHPRYSRIMEVTRIAYTSLGIRRHIESFILEYSPGSEYAAQMFKAFQVTTKNQVVKRGRYYARPNVARVELNPGS